MTGPAQRDERHHSIGYLVRELRQVPNRLDVDWRRKNRAIPQDCPVFKVISRPEGLLRAHHVSAQDAIGGQDVVGGIDDRVIGILAVVAIVTQRRVSAPEAGLVVFRLVRLLFLLLFLTGPKPFLCEPLLPPLGFGLALFS